ncbi:coenzyme PQQ synthesis protein D (PqqD) [Sphingomonas aurantiaca]|uniref:Coenzyme PQQ synthesis protein D (PqqD) n=1 Tax=Sphingomonas aurantiaca TaxID=185949 RepID=A0A2T5GG84_9SPHN|nr:PqqD family protein [Sphingomonas aurantiaca]PTQ58330.1 coenzyme PQQ synthesis protein D (PqqD) [Sphingomonas aurantiaca]
MTETLWQRTDQWVGTEVEDSFVMINLETGTYLTLNATANAVWDVLETPQTQEAVEAALLDRFDVVPEDCTTAVTSLLAKMRDMKLASPV